MAASALRIRSMTFSASRGQKRDADAGGQEHFLLVDVERARRPRSSTRARQLRDLLAVSSASARRPSTNSANSSPARRPSTVSLRQHARQALGQHLEHAVAGGMAEGVVDLLEAVHVDVQQRHALAVAPRARDRLLQQVLELHAVRDLGQRVVARQVADAALGALALGDVARDVDVAGELRVVGGDARAGERHRDGLAGAGAQHGLAGLARRLQQSNSRALALSGVQQDRDAADAVPPRCSRSAAGRARWPSDRAVGGGDEHRVAHAVEHAVQVVLVDGGLAQRLAHALERLLAASPRRSGAALSTGWVNSPRPMRSAAAR